MAGTIIPAIQLDTMASIKSLFEQHINRELLESYRLPVADHRARVIIGLSGGADSSVLALFAALYLAPHYPNIEFLFTDTKTEPASCYATLDKIETLTGILVKRLIPEKGLFELVEEYNGYLPSARSRWCTGELKVKPLLAYLRSITTAHGYVSLAGIRYDEAGRDGVVLQHTMENGATAYPFVELHITKAMVFDILHRSIGIPGTYAYRSRSGCVNCFFQRNAEIVGMLMHNPQDFARTERYEKLTAVDRARWSVIPQSLADAGIHAYYPVPAFIDIRKPEKVQKKGPVTLKSNAEAGIGDLFDSEHLESEQQGNDLFAAFALYVDSRLGQFGGREFTPGVHWQEFVTISTSLPGIKSALGHYYSFKKTTPMPQYDVNDLHIVIVQIRFLAGTVDTARPGKGSYTWKQGVAYQQLRYLVKHCQATLQGADLERRYQDAVNALRQAECPDVALDAAEQVDILKDQLKKAPQATGRLVWEGLYVPSLVVEKQVQLQLTGISTHTKIKPARQGLEFDEVPRACIACSI